MRQSKSKMSAPIDISHGLSAAEVLSWSDDYCMAIATTKCVYLISLQCDPSDLSSSFVFKKLSVPTPSEGLKFNVDINVKSLHEGCNGVPSNISRSLQMDRTLSPEFGALPSYTVYKTVKWSPAKCDPNGRCVLACLTRDHRLTIYRQSAKTNKLIKFAELSLLWYQHLKSANYNLQTDAKKSYDKKDKQQTDANEAHHKEDKQRTDANESNMEDKQQTDANECDDKDDRQQSDANVSNKEDKQHTESNMEDKQQTDANESNAKKDKQQTDRNKSYDKKDKDSVFNEYKRRCYMLAATEMQWSRVYTSSSDNPSDSERLESSDRDYCLLAVVMKSSDVVLWRFNLPITENTSSNPCMMGVISTGLPSISSCAWYKPQAAQCTDKYSFLAIGSREGTIGIWRVNMAEEDPTKTSTCCLEVWSEKDLISVGNMAWGFTNTKDSKPLLVAVKGVFIMVFMLDIHESNVSLLHKTHMCSNHVVSITGLCVAGNLTVTCSTDGSVQKTVISATENDLNMDVELMEAPKPTQLRYCGIAISPGRTYVALAAELCKIGKTFNRASKILVKPLRSEAEAEADILNTKGLFCSKLDSIELFRQSIVANYTLPDALEGLTGDQFWKSKELRNCPFKLKLRRYLLKMKKASVLYTINQKTRGRDVEVSTELKVLLESTIEDIGRNENQLVLLHVIEAMINWRKVEKNQPKVSDHPNIPSLLIMSDVLQNASLEDDGDVDDVDKSVISEIQVQYIAHESAPGEREKCQICSEIISFSNVNIDACCNGHQWQRCCLSLQLCQLDATRRCQHCDSLALKPDIDRDSKWMLNLLNDRCLFCDGALLPYN